MLDEAERALHALRTDADTTAVATGSELPVAVVEGGQSVQGPTPPMRSAVMRITCPGGGSSMGGNFTPGPT